MRKPDKETDELILYLIDDKGWTMEKVAHKMGLKSKSTIHEKYHRAKYGVRRKKKKVIHR